MISTIKEFEISRTLCFTPFEHIVFDSESLSLESTGIELNLMLRFKQSTFEADTFNSTNSGFEGLSMGRRRLTPAMVENFEAIAKTKLERVSLSLAQLLVESCIYQGKRRTRYSPSYSSASFLSSLHTQSCAGRIINNQISKNSKSRPSSIIQIHSTRSLSQAYINNQQLFNKKNQIRYQHVDSDHHPTHDINSQRRSADKY